MILYLLSCHVYHALLFLVKDIHLILVYNHIFLSIGLFNPIITFSFPLVCLTLLMIYMIWAVMIPCLWQHPWCTILSVRPCYYYWWHSGNRRWTRTMPNGLPRIASRKMVLFVPRPWYRRCCQHSWQTILWHALLSWTCKMSPPFLHLIHPYHSSTGSKPDSPAPLSFQGIFCTWLRM